MNISIGYRTNLFKRLLLVLAFTMAANCSLTTTALAQFQPSNNMNPMDHGPFVTTTIAYDPVTTNSIFVNKGIAVKVGEAAQAVMTFDTDLLRVASAWTGGFLNWYPERDGLEDWPTPGGFTHFETSKTPGWSLDGEFEDPRTWPYGPIPKEQGHYKGLHVHGSKVLFSYTIGDIEILETPGFEEVESHSVFTRTFELTPTEETLSLRVLQAPDEATLDNQNISASKEYVKIPVSYTHLTLPTIYSV